MKITVLVARYSISGVPLAQIRLARALAEDGHQVTLIFGYAGSHRPPPIQDVELRIWDHRQTRGLFRPVISIFRKERPDIVFSAEDHLNVIVLIAALLTRSKSKISISSRVTPFDTYSNRPLTKRWFLKHLSRATFARADALTCVSRDMVGQYREVFGQTRHRAIYNIVDDPPNRARITQPAKHRWFEGSGPPIVVGAGSLQPWKGFADLIAAIGYLRDRGRHARLLILGEGPQRPELESLIAKLDLADRIDLAGHVENPLAVFAQASLFVLSSRVEGLPNVLVEAMMAGCPVIATDCPTGPREVLDDGRFGLLVPVGDVQGLAAAISTMLESPTDPALLAEAVRAFTAEAVLAAHFDALGLQ